MTPDPAASGACARQAATCACLTPAPACAAAQETRELRRRDKEWSDGLISKYYSEQRSIDAAAASASKDDLRRREREGKERQAEHDLVQNIYRVRCAQLPALHERGRKMHSKRRRRHGQGAVLPCAA